MKQRSARKRYIDVSRGIAILLVVLGHSITRDMADASLPAGVVRMLIYSVHMPLFFFISGYLFRVKEKEYFCSPAINFIRSKFSSLMVPYISFSVLNYLMIYAASRIPGISLIMENNGYVCGGIGESLFQILTFEGHLDTHLWFCYVMFLVLCINRLLIRRNTSFTFAIMMLLYAFWSAWLTCGNTMPQIVGYSMHYMYVFCAGRLWREHEDSLKRLTLLAGPVWAISFSLMMAADLSDMVALRSVIAPFTELSSSIFIVFCISCRPKARMSDHRSQIHRLLERIGRSDVSFPLYLLHMPFIVPACVLTLSKAGMPIPAVILISAAIGMAASLLIRSVLFRSAVIKKLFFGLKKQAVS